MPVKTLAALIVWLFSVPAVMLPLAATLKLLDVTESVFTPVLIVLAAPALRLNAPDVALPILVALAPVTLMFVVPVSVAPPVPVIAPVPASTPTAVTLPVKVGLLTISNVRLRVLLPATVRLLLVPATKLRV